MEVAFSLEAEDVIFVVATLVQDRNNYNLDLKIRFFFLSGENLGKEANFLPARVGSCISLAVEDVLFASVWQ